MKVRGYEVCTIGGYIPKTYLAYVLGFYSYPINGTCDLEGHWCSNESSALRSLIAKYERVVKEQEQ